MPADPGTRSPGFLTLVYNTFGIQHEASVRFIVGVDINDVASIRTDATNLANAVKACVTSSTIITAWRVKDPNHVRLYEEAFSPVVTGTHTGTGTSWLSLTYTITGKGVPIDLAHASGQTRFELFAGSPRQPAAGEKNWAASSDTSWQALVTLFHSNLRYFADFFGQHAEPRSTITTQFNAAVQRRRGT